MLLSACILMKGDLEQLRRLVVMASPLADEIIAVCDAPASEALHAAAVECGVNLVPHDWQNDFAGARNAGLMAARGEWVFWIDCDETLVAPEAPAFRKLLERTDVLGYYVNIEDLTDGASRTIRQHPSLYRRRPELCYFGRVHEHFEPTLEVLADRLGMKVAVSPVRLQHAGYQLEERPHKLKRNIALLELELADRPGQLYYQIELGRSLLLAGQPRGYAVLAEAAWTLRPAQANQWPPNPLVAAFLEYVLGHAPAGFPLSRSEAAMLAARWFPANPPLLWRSARWHYEQGHLQDAADLLQQVLELGETRRYDNTLSFDQRIFGDETRVNLGVCCAKLGQLDKAEKQFQRIAAGSSFFTMAQANLAHLRQGGISSPSPN